MKDKFQNILSGVIYALSMMVEYKDPYTAGHQQRVASLACAIGEKMGVCGDKLVGIRIAGLLHDIGKIAVPIEILSKPGKITKSEFMVIKDHPKIGYEILRTIRFPWPVAQVVLQHHERINGRGYPAGLLGKDILPEAKIIVVADVVEAMTANRAYRSAIGKDGALLELTENKGELYDEAVVEACLKVLINRNSLFEGGLY